MERLRAAPPMQRVAGISLQARPLEATARRIAAVVAEEGAAVSEEIAVAVVVAEVAREALLASPKALQPHLLHQHRAEAILRRKTPLTSAVTRVRRMVAGTTTVGGTTKGARRRATRRTIRKTIRRMRRRMRRRKVRRMRHH